jgi:prephenate dehydrogenase
MPERVAILGLGLIGGSIGGALREQSTTVIGYDVSRATSDRAHALGLVDEVTERPEEAIAESDVAILAMPVRAVIRALQTLTFAPGTLVLDTGSTKLEVTAAMEGVPEDIVAIGGHPIAGREISGPDAADTALFRGRPFILTPTGRTTETGMARARTLIRRLGALPIIMGAADHDRTIALTSHLPQVVSSALAIALEGQDCVLAGTGLRDMSRLAGSDPAMWADIALTNGEHIVNALDRMQGALRELREAIEAGDSARLSDLLSRARAVSSAIREYVAA